MKAEAVLRRGDPGKQLFRFCFQCAKLEQLSRFDANKRSCRIRLQARKEREALDKEMAESADRCSDQARSEQEEQDEEEEETATHLGCWTHEEACWHPVSQPDAASNLTAAVGSAADQATVTGN